MILQARNRTLTEEQRIKLLEQADAIQQKIYETNKKQADDEYAAAVENIRLKTGIKGQELENLKELGAAYVFDAENKAKIRQDDIDSLIAAQKKTIQVEDEKTRLEEVRQYTKDQLADQAADKEQKRKEEAADKEQKRKEEAQKRLDEEVKAEQDARQKQLEARQKLYDFNKKLKDKEKADEEKRQQKYRDWETDRKSTRLNSSHSGESRMPSSA